MKSVCGRAVLTLGDIGDIATAAASTHNSQRVEMMARAILILTLHVSIPATFCN